jgi:hypothetical protein
MGLLDEIRVLVGDLEAAFSLRVDDERERLATAGQDAQERVADIAVLRSDVAEMLGEFRQERFTRSAEDARERAENERERLAVAGEDARERAGNERERLAVARQDARERTAEVLELGRIWSDHSVAMLGFRGSVFSPRRPAVITRRSPAPAAARPKPATSAPAAAKRKPATSAPATRPKPARSAPAAAKRKPVKPVSAKSAPAEPMPAETMPAETMPAETAAAKPAPAEPVTAAAITGYLADRPDGVKLKELETRFGGDPDVLRPILDEMITDKKLRKDEESKLYFAA